MALFQGYHRYQESSSWRREADTASSAEANYIDRLEMACQRQQGWLIMYPYCNAFCI
jgi:hypothetical protein